ncbi:helix-turn-helix domain-containing protein [Streptomyces sp. AV19]|uniref:helix-turn-helix domain-containing protein n=1 Tax=Streptomyces sp. AV19 TaxID=2793068 RepID=UPI0018FE81F1|nr:helix-turn-helix transcriptional regulator [Streptomyces sp. AV19]MBH1936045.1 helix-turn-helix domain-containing protein [Streptomyces sp. AV19]MDG4534163.1 helix-turn-helix domain-containing protein [Streptomyces sp. AV19]
MTFEPEQLGQSKTDLAATLRQLRKRAGLSQVRLARRCNMSQTKVSNIESGKVTPNLVDVELILRALEAPAQLVSEITALARIANTEWRDDRSSLRRGLDKRQNELAGLEKSSTDLRYFLPTMITGLLATPEYVRASIADAPGDRTKTVAKKLERQAVLYDRSKQFRFVLTEQAVRWPLVPPDVLAVQIDHLASLTHLPNVHIGVIPIGHDVKPGPLSVFTVYGDSMATVETPTGVLIFKDHRDISAYLDEFAAHEAHAVFGEQAREKLADWASSCRS